MKETDQENITDLTMNLFKEQMGVDIKTSDIDRVHRTGRKDISGKIRPVLVKFATYRARAAVYRAKARLKGNHLHDIFVNEDLTKVRSQLLFTARQMKKTKKIADCWTFDGRIFLKTNSNIVKSVTNEEDLQNASSA